MIQRRKAYCISCLAGLCLIFSSCATKTVDTSEPVSANTEASTMTFDEASIKAIIEKAEPLIEEFSGLVFKEEIKFSLVKRDAFRDSFADALLPMYKTMMKGVDSDTIARQVEAIAHQTSQDSLGLYFPSEKKILLIPENAQIQSDRYEIKKEDFQDFLSLYVTYRMVAALDDQHFNLTEKQAAIGSNQESSMAFRALTEGHAVYITNKVAERLKLSEAVKNLYLKSVAGITDESNPMQQQVLDLRYLKGREFVEAVIGKKGTPGVNEAFASPPVSMRQIMNPEEYLTPSTEAVFDCLELMKKVAEKLPTEGMQSQTVPLNSTTLSSVLVSQGVQAADAISVTADCLNGAVVTAVKQAQKPIITTATILNFVTGEAVGNYVALTRKIEESSRAQVNAMLNAKLKIVKEEQLKPEGFDTVKYTQVETTVDNQVTKSFSAEGIIDNFYFSVAFINPEKEQNEESVLDILTNMNKERLSMM